MSAVAWRQSFAAFLTRLASDSVRDGEWSDLVVTHYSDEDLEAIRRDLVRLKLSRNPSADLDAWQPEDRQQMLAWAEQLRGTGEEEARRGVDC